MKIPDFYIRCDYLSGSSTFDESWCLWDSGRSTLNFNVCSYDSPLTAIILAFNYAAYCRLSVIVKTVLYLPVLQKVVPEIYLHNAIMIQECCANSNQVSYLFKVYSSNGKEEVANAINTIFTALQKLNSVRTNEVSSEILASFVQKFRASFLSNSKIRTYSTYEEVFSLIDLLNDCSHKIEIHTIVERPEASDETTIISNDEFRQAIENADIKKIEKYLRLFPVSDNEEFYSNSGYLALSVICALNDSVNFKKYLEIIELLLLYRVPMGSYQWLTPEEHIFNSLSQNWNSGDGDVDTGNIIKLLKTANPIASLVNIKSDFMSEVWQSNNQKLQEAVKLIVEENESVKKRKMQKNTYNQVSFSIEDRTIITEFYTNKQKKLYALTKRISDLTEEEKSQLWYLFKSTFKLVSNDYGDLFNYFKKEIANVPLRFIDLLMLDNYICGFVIYQFFFLAENHKEAVITHLRLTAVDAKISKEFPRIMTILLTRPGFGLSQTMQGYDMGTFAEIVSSSAMAVFEVEEFESSFLYEEPNEIISFLYKKIYGELEFEKVYYDDKARLYHVQEPLETQGKINGEVVQSDSLTRTSSVCKKFSRVKKPQHAVLYFFENHKLNQNAISKRINPELDTNRKLDFATINSVFGSAICKISQYQDIPKSMVNTTKPPKNYCRL